MLRSIITKMDSNDYIQHKLIELNNETMRTKTILDLMFLDKLKANGVGDFNVGQLYPINPFLSYYEQHVDKAIDMFSQNVTFSIQSQSSFQVLPSYRNNEEKYIKEYCKCRKGIQELSKKIAENNSLLKSGNISKF